MMIDPALLKACVAHADEHAFNTVRAGQGGPFGAALYVVAEGVAHPAGLPAGNSVLVSGIASAHAEDGAMNPASIAEARRLLKQYGADAHLLLASSGESCPACHAKAEILARILMSEGALKPGHFIVAYGASVADTAAIAGFNDAHYREDMAAAPAARLIAHDVAGREGLPAPLQALLEQYPSVVVMPDGSLHAGRDRTDHHFTLTPEVEAMRAASAAKMDARKAHPWDLEGATLYTARRDIGPLTYAEAQWANIGRIVSLSDGTDMLEAPFTSNGDLWAAVTQRPYNAPPSALYIVRVDDFANKAQREWARLRGENPNMPLYNGV